MMPLTVDGNGLVWLEDGKGLRSFQVASISSTIDVDGLRASVSRTRDSIESAWLQWCVARGWLDYSPSEATIYVYPGTSHELVRHLKEEAFVPEFLQTDSATNSACLAVRLNRAIWRGADDGSDATAL
jgi:hypothetical protein